jgi:phosphatidylinositol-4,5-bisphosphate 3-kinase/phosphatidylinositol-4-phosphate 3-kinase
MQYSEENEIFGNQTKYYGNFRLFDHNLRLKCGLHKVNLYSGLFKDDAYYYFMDNDEEDKCSKVYFEIEHFNKTVYNRITHIKNYTFDGSFMISESEEKKIEEIKERSYFEEMNTYDRKILWDKRYKLSGEPQLFSKLLSCVEYNDPKHLIELEKILEMAKELNSIDSIGLLGGRFLHESIRNFAVKCLRKSPNIEIKEFLYELIHGLRYEINHDNELARFLLEKAIKYPVTIGHTFYWILKSQMYEQNFQQRYGLYLEIFLNKIGPNLAKIFFDEDILMTKLEEICETQKNKKLGKKDKLKSFNDSITGFNNHLTEQLHEISLPIDFKLRVDKINFEECKVQLKDSKIELIVNFKNVDPLGDNIIVNYYNDKDIRIDLVTMQLFNILHTIWCENNYKLKMPLYHVMTTSRNKGLIQLIPDTLTLDEMPIKETSGFKNLFGKKSLNKYLTLNSGISPEEVYQNFISSNSAYCVANFIIGVTQRNKKNIHFKRDGEIYYTNYDHILNHYTKALGDRGVPFLFNVTFVDFLNKLNKLKDFKELFMKAFIVMRNRSKDIIKLLEILLSSGLPEISNKSLHFMEDSLSLTKTEKEAEETMEKILSIIMDKK